VTRSVELGGPRPRPALPFFVAASLTAVGLGAVGAACPSRNLDIQVDSNGLVTVLAACDAISHICDGKVSDTCDHIFCEWIPDPRSPLMRGTCQIKSPCTLSLPEVHQYESNTATALQLILLSADPAQLQAGGPCMCFDENDFVCPDTGPDGGGSATDCWSASINARLAAGIPNGLTFGGFSSPDQGVLAMAWFQPPIRGATCADFADSGASLCVEQNMVACAGLGAPPGDATYDITCASCQGGVHSAIGNDNGPCLTAPDVCFLQTCAAALFGTTLGAGGGGGACGGL
jgi:hypothetical protein